MEIDVMVESLNGNGFRATSLTPMLTAEAPTRQEAIDRLHDLVRKRLAQVEMVKFEVPVPGEDHPWARVFGCLKDHPDMDKVEEYIQEYRRQRNAELDEV